MDEFDFSELSSLGQSYDPAVLNQIVRQCRGANMPDTQIAVLAANSIYESGNNPNASGGPYRGLWQWHKSQLSNFKMGDVTSQINYIIADTARGRWPQGKDTFNGWNPKHYKVWINPKSTISQLSDAFELGYERRGKTDIKRRQAAQLIYNIITGK